ncbi:MAG: Hsp20/alpha crystallin family protein [Planctomycetes bacterium]|nr:Hsp20/alpha crystallin family protein [Planctomycetota bacterium]NUQ34004.1 Hsp20/alpha crystallin family protein [Planctomycetaceae bacterium]
MYTLSRVNNGQTFDNALDRFFSGGFRSLLRDWPETEANVALLPVDVSETDKAYVVRASLPGFSRDKIDIEVVNDVLSINAQWEEVSEEKDEKFHIKERRARSLSRQIQLPGGVSGNAVDAEMKDGVLTITVPKSEESKPRKVKIK